MWHVVEKEGIPTKPGNYVVAYWDNVLGMLKFGKRVWNNKKLRWSIDTPDKKILAYLSLSDLQRTCRIALNMEIDK